MKSIILWDVTPYSLVCDYQHFGGTCCFHLQDLRVSQESNKHRHLLHGLLFNPEDRYSTLLRNVGKCLPVYMTSHFRKQCILKSCFILIRMPIGCTGNWKESTTNEKTKKRFGTLHKICHRPVLSEQVFIVFNFQPDDVKRGPPTVCRNSCDRILFLACTYMNVSFCFKVV
jgi:hypothetical protein